MSLFPALEPRFLEPPGWRRHNFSRTGKNGHTRRLRFGSVFPQDKIPDGIVVCLPGLGDFCEKYFETAHTLLAKNLAFWVIDWVGQGHATRYLPNPHKRHSAGFDEDIADLHTWIENYIIPASVHPDVGRIPRAMLAHSMGGNIGLHYLQRYPDMFECAAFSAPMWGIRALDFLPDAFTRIITTKMSALMGKQYIPGGMDWKEAVRSFPGKDIFSSDPVRGAIHNAWCLHDPALQVGGVTNKWLHEAVKSCAGLHKKNIPESIYTPCLVGLAGKDMLVSNKDIKLVSTRLACADMLNLPQSQHEILLECDEIRTVFLDGFYDLIKKTIIENPESLKQF